MYIYIIPYPPILLPARPPFRPPFRASTFPSAQHTRTPSDTEDWYLTNPILPIPQPPQSLSMIIHDIHKSHDKIFHSFFQ